MILEALYLESISPQNPFVWVFLFLSFIVIINGTGDYIGRRLHVNCESAKN